MKIFKHPILLETACGHDGKESVLKKLVNIAKNSGAKQIKFQIFNIEERAEPNTKEYKIFKPLILNENSWKKILNYTKKQKLSVFADVYGDYKLYKTICRLFTSCSTKYIPRNNGKVFEYFCGITTVYDSNERFICKNSRYYS